VARIFLSALKISMATAFDLTMCFLNESFKELLLITLISIQGPAWSDAIIDDFRSGYRIKFSKKEPLNPPLP